MKTTKTFNALISALEAGKLESNNQLTYMMSLLNNGSNEQKEIISKTINNSYENISLCEDQVKKGYNWLKNLWVSPTGKERKNNPFGYREQEILENFETITMRSYYDAGNYYRSFQVPLYEVSGNGTTFEYYVSGGQIHITG